MFTVLLAIGILASTLGTSDAAALKVQDGIAYPTASTGLWSRFAAGDIDREGSPAYNRWGRGFVHGLADSDRKFTAPGR